ncbi:MAG: hypothetical protein P4L77_12050 [Sulfuriferula sp.]|nr:hypothetical protein [Sulfuriferula sp.]
MKKLLLVLMGCLIGAPLFAQTTAISATVVDADSTTWANGNWTLAFTPNPSTPNPAKYNINSVPLDPAVMNQKGLIDGSGNLSFSVYQTAPITPVGSSWTLTVCPNASAPCGVYNFTAIGSSMNIGSALTPLIPAPRFRALAGSYGYVDTEAIVQNTPGSTYWNVTSACQRYWSGSGWSCPTGTVVTYPITIDKGGTSGTSVNQVAGNLGTHGPVINILGYGAVGDGVTDNCTALTNAAAAIPATGGQFFIPAGKYYTTCGVTFPYNTDAAGLGICSQDMTQCISTITTAGTTLNVFNFTAKGGRAHDFSILNTSGAPTAGSGINVSGSYIYQTVNINNMFISGFWNDVSESGEAYHVTDSYLVNAFNDGFYGTGGVSADTGDCFINGNLFTAGANGADAAIHLYNTGGCKIQNTKAVYGLNGGAPRFNYGLYADIGIGLTEELIFTGNNIDQVLKSPVYIATAPPYSVIANNFLGVEYAGYPAIYDNYANSHIIGGNTFKNGSGVTQPAAIVFDGITVNSTLYPNTLQGFTTTKSGFFDVEAPYNNRDYSQPLATTNPGAIAGLLYCSDGLGAATTTGTLYPGGPCSMQAFTTTLGSTPSWYKVFTGTTGLPFITTLTGDFTVLATATGVGYQWIDFHVDAMSSGTGNCPVLSQTYSSSVQVIDKIRCSWDAASHLQLEFETASLSPSGPATVAITGNLVGGATINPTPTSGSTPLGTGNVILTLQTGPLNHGTLPYVQRSDNTGASGHYATYDINGNLTDGSSGYTGTTSCTGGQHIWSVTIVNGLITGAPSCN